jgi:hypothetical protein
MIFKNNLTTTFLLHTIRPNLKIFKQFNFQEAYIFDAEHDTLYDNCLYLKFKPKDKNSEDYQKFEEILFNTGIILDVYDVEEYRLYVAQVKEEFHEDLQKFLEGEYSKFSTKLKSRMCSVDDSLIRGIVDKEEYARIALSKHYGIDIPRHQEYCSKPNLKNEIYRYSENE